MNENYRIITGADTAELVKKVNKAIAEGYAVSGGVTLIANGSTLIQAVTKE